MSSITVEHLGWLLIIFFFRYKPYDDDDNDFCDLALRYCYFCGALLPTLVMPPVQPIDLRFFFVCFSAPIR